MGYSYDSARRLCCDNCGHAGGCRRVKCPHGYCGPDALCAACRKDPVVKAKLAAHHETECRPAAVAFAARKAREAALLDAGHSLRCAAIGIGDAVKVTFRDKTGKTTDYLMATETYRSIPLVDPATPADYEALGVLRPVTS